MYASIQRQPVSWINLMRWAGRTSGALLILTWLGFATVELFHPGFAVRTLTLAQAAALAIVFTGYAVGWRREWVGGLLTLLGMAAFLAAVVLSIGVPPAPATALFAAPGVFFLLAYFLGFRFGASKPVQISGSRRQFEELFFAHLCNGATRGRKV